MKRKYLAMLFFLLPLSIFCQFSIDYYDAFKMATLNLSGLGLTEIPTVSCYFDGVVDIAFSGNKFISIPDDIKNLGKTVFSVNMSNNKITELGDGIFELTNVDNLDFQINEITKISKNIGNLTNLKMLFLNTNKLTDIPKEISGCITLKGLFLSNNQLKTLPLELSKCRGLESLDLSGNQLTEIPIVITFLTNLRTLDLTRNLLTPAQKEAGKRLFPFAKF